jgi:hypothetical protein
LLMKIGFCSSSAVAVGPGARSVETPQGGRGNLLFERRKRTCCLQLEGIPLLI